MRLYRAVLILLGVHAALWAVGLWIAVWIGNHDGAGPGFEVDVHVYGLILAIVLASGLLGAGGWAALVASRLAVQRYAPAVVKAEVERALQELMPTMANAVGEAMVAEMETRTARMLNRNHARTMAAMRELLQEKEFVELLDSALARSRSYGQTVETRLRAASGGTVTTINSRER